MNISMKLINTFNTFQWGRLPRLQIVNSNESRNSMEQLSVAEGKLGNVMTRLLGVDIFNKKLEMDEERWSWSMLFMAIDPIVGHIQLITFVHPNQQVCPWGTRIQDRPLWRGAREEERWRGQRTRGGGGANPGLPEAAVQPDSWRKESKQARGKETLGLLSWLRRPMIYMVLISSCFHCCHNCQL